MSGVFVDRDDTMATLRGVAHGLAEGTGRALVLEGDSGMGKTAALTEFVRRAQNDASLGSCRLVPVRCRPGIGAGDLYGPVLDALVKLKEQAKPRTRWWRAAGRGAVQSGPALLAALVPGLAPVIEAGKDFTEAALSSGSVPGDSLRPQEQAVALQIANALVDEASPASPVMVLIDDIQYADLGSLHVLDRLLESLRGRPLSLVLGHGTYATTTCGNAGEVAALLQHREADNLLSRHRLEGLPDSAVARLVDARYQESAPSALPARLSEVTAGHPIFVEQCLRLWQPVHGDRVPLPESLPVAVQRRFERLDERVQELLVIAATQGESFLSRTVAEAAGVPHEEVMERLRRTAQLHGLIRERSEPPHWVRWARSDWYEFEHRALRQGIYAQQSTRQKQQRHARLAEALRAVADATGPEPPLELRLLIARQLRNAGPDCLARSAATHYALARSAAVDGLSFADAERHCEVAIRAASDLPADSGDRDRQFIEAVELLLALTEVRWQGSSTPAGGPDIDALAAQAEQAARRLGDRTLIARTTLLRGKTLLATQGLEPSLAKLRDAVGRARESEDPVALFVAKVEYGRQLPKRDLRAGLRELFEAEQLYAADSRLGETRNPVLQHARNLNEMQLGVNLFDSGRFGEARTRLLRCAQRLRSEPLRAELPIALNYLAQLHLAMGADQEAEDALREARSFEEARSGDSGWHAYNGALLALLLSRAPERRAECLELIEAAWLETQRTWLANLVPIVRNLYAEVLLNTARAPETLDQAYRLAADTCAETRLSGMVRSEIAAYDLRGRVRLRHGDVTGAAGHAREALRILNDVGDMPALRTEEVLYHAGRAMRAAGAEGEADELLARARAEVVRKADHIDVPAQRRRFLSEVPLNREILGEDPPR